MKMACKPRPIFEQACDKVTQVMSVLVVQGLDLHQQTDNCYAANPIKSHLT